MLQKTSSTTAKYKAGKEIKVTVKNTPHRSKDLDDDWHVSEFTLKVSVAQDGPLEFESVEDIAKFVKKLKIEDPQIKLNLGDHKK